MKSELNNAPLLISGREFTTEELVTIQETIGLFPNLSQHELAQTICENLGWVTPNGRNKVEACMQVLKKLAAQGLITLPAKRSQMGRQHRQVIPGPRTEPGPELIGEVRQYKPIEVQPVRSKEAIHLWNEYIERYHPLGYKRPFGAHQRYFIISGSGLRLGCLLFTASAWALIERDKWIGWTVIERSQRLHLIVNNTRFLIYPWVHIRNLASKALSYAARRIRSDWQKRYGYQPVLLETFVDGANYHGSCYRAANWLYLGQTAGRGRMDQHTQYLSTPKEIYVYPLVADWRPLLCSQEKEDGGRGVGAR